MTKRIWPLLVFIMICGFLARGLQLNPKTMPSVVIGKKLPEQSLSLWGQKNHPVTFSKWQGQLIILHFWATWCDSCNQDIAQLQSLHQKSKAQLLGINYKDTKQELQKWLLTHSEIFDDIILDKKGLLGMDLGVVATPETFIVDKQGIIRFRYQGPLTETVIQQQILPTLAEYDR